MGVLVTNSALRELIPHSTSGNLDESARLSASDLIVILENIRARSEDVREKVQKTVTNYKEEFLRIITQSNRTVLNVEKVSEQLKNVLKLFGEQGVPVGSPGSRSFGNKNSSEEIDALDDLSAEFDKESGGVNGRSPVDVELCRLAEDVRRLRTEVKERQEALVVVETISSLHNLLLATEKKIFPGELVEAARGMVILQEKLGLQDENDETPKKSHDVKVFKLLQDAWSDRYSKLLGLLEDLVSKAIVFDPRRSELSVIQYIQSDVVEVVTDAGAVDLSSIFTAMDVLGILDVRLAQFGDSIFRHVLSPLLKNSRMVISTLVLASGTATAPRSVLKWSVGTETAETVPELLYPKIVQVIKFLNDHVFCNHDGRMTRFGRAAWPRLADAIIAGCLTKAVPNETSQLKDFEKVAEATANFEKELANEGLIANFDPDKGDKLGTFTSEVEVHFSLKKKKKLIVKVRDLIMQSDYSLQKSKWTSLNGEDFNKSLDRSVHLLFDPCALSLLATSLLETVHNALEDACLSTPRTAWELYNASRDAIIMYRALIPLKLQSASDKLQTAALCYNDCCYIAHEVLTFLFQYREAMPSELKPFITFVDLVPPYRKMAVDVLDQEIKVVRCEVMQGLDHAGGFRYTDEEKHFQLAEESLEEVFGTFENVGKQLRPVLAHNVYKKLVGQLISLAVGRVVSEVLAITDMAVQETIQLQKLLSTVQDRFPCFLEPAVVDGSAKEQVEEEAVEVLVPVWQKLKTLINLLDMSLISINQAWESGNLSSAGFSSSEVQRLVMAIFSETPFREECLNRIGSSP